MSWKKITLTSQQIDDSNHWGHWNYGVNHPATCLVRWPMKQPLKSVLHRVFHIVKFPALFCSRETVAVSGWNSNFPFSDEHLWLPWPPSLQYTLTKCFLHFDFITFYLSVGPKTAAHSPNLQECPSTTEIWRFCRNTSTCWKACTFLFRLLISLLCDFYRHPISENNPTVFWPHRNVGDRQRMEV